MAPSPDHREHLLATIRFGLDRLGVDGADREHQVDALIALVGGMLLEACLGHRGATHARSLLARHLVSLVPTPR